MSEKHRSVCTIPYPGEVPSAFEPSLLESPQWVNSCLSEAAACSAHSNRPMQSGKGFHKKKAVKQESIEEDGVADPKLKGPKHSASSRMFKPISIAAVCLVFSACKRKRYMPIGSKKSCKKKRHAWSCRSLSYFWHPLQLGDFWPKTCPP